MGKAIAAITTARARRRWAAHQEHQIWPAPRARLTRPFTRQKLVDDIKILLRKTEAQHLRAAHDSAEDNLAEWFKAQLLSTDIFHVHEFETNIFLFLIFSFFNHLWLSALI